MKTIKDIKDLEGQRVLVRVDWNVRVENGQVLDEFRIKKSLPTLEFLKSRGAKLIIATHLEPVTTSMEPFKKYLPEGAELLENLRLNPGEEANSEDFAKFLAGKADIYVNEAFSVSHRKHASIIGVPKFLPSYIGLQFEKEVAELSKSFNPPKPFFIILGGVKFETKLPLVERLLPLADFVFIGGGMAKAAALTPLVDNPKIFFCVGDSAAIDANPETLELIREKVNASKFILWNGPLGNYENGYTDGTLALAKILAESGKEVVVGGGDTLTAIEKLQIVDKFSFVSTGGGATLDFLANGTLPGIQALK
ncbi:MAG: phosphoglycerate kinase [Candidatus Paceibacterota bacterium]|jgi:phosphoglycerate kinase